MVTELWSAGGTHELGGVIVQQTPWDGAIGPDGIVGIVDPLSAKLTLVGPDGRLAKELGSRGSGPGEFQEMRRVGFLGDSLIWISDGRLGRITLFDHDGDVVDIWKRPWSQIPRSSWSARGEFALSNGSVVGKGVDSYAGVESSAEGTVHLLPLAVWNPAGDLNVVDWLESEAPTYLAIPTRQGPPITGRQRIAAGPIIGTERNGAWFFVLDRTPTTGRAGRILITRYRPSGEILGQLEIRYRPAPVTDSVMTRLEQIAEAYEEQLPRRYGIKAEDVMRALWIPERLPPVRAAFADDGGFWLQREMSSPGLWERYDLTGRLIARIRLPPQFRGLAGSRTSLLGFEHDSMDVPVIRRYEVAIPGHDENHTS